MVCLAVYLDHVHARGGLAPHRPQVLFKGLIFLKKVIIKCLTIFFPVLAWSIPRKLRKLLQNWEKVEIIFYDFCREITAY